MKKASIFILPLIIFSVFIFNFSVFKSNAATPSDYGLKEGDLISAIFSDDPDVYIVNEHGYKRLFLNPDIFKFYSHLGGFANIKLVTPEIRDSFPTSGFFRNCEDNDQKVYGTSVEGEDNGRLHWINKSGDQAVQEDPDFFKKVFCINRKEFNWYPRGSEFKALKEVPQYHRSAEVENPVICHHPSDDPSTFQTIRVAPESLDTHFQHGDTRGACSTSSVQQTSPVDVKINGSDFPSGVPYDSVFIVSWTSKDAVSCRDFGQFIPAVDGGTWAKFINLPTSGTKSLYARASEGYLATLDIQVQCTNAAGQFSDDVIHLTVQPPATLTPSVSAVPTTSNPIVLTSPNGGEWKMGQAYEIRWKQIENTPVTIELQNKQLVEGYSPWYSTAIARIDEKAGENSYSWTVPSNLNPHTGYEICVVVPYTVGSASPTFRDCSEPAFYISGSEIVKPLPSLSIGSPNGGEIFQKGTTQLIKWNSSNVSKIYIKLRKGNDTYPGPEGMITDVIPNVNGYYKWWIPTTLPDGNDYSVRIIDGDYTGGFDDSDKPFSIVSTTPQITPSVSPVPTSTPSISPSITVLSPNGGEQWQSGNYYEVKWTNTTGKNINLELIKGNNIVAGWSSIGSTVSVYNVGLPLPLETGSDYRIKITTVDTSNVDSSDAPFSIVSMATPTPTPTSTPTPTGSALAPPQSVTASLGTGKISVVWSGGITSKYKIYRCLASFGCGGALAYSFLYTSSDTSYDDYSVISGTVFRYKIYGCDSSGSSCSTTGTESNEVTYSASTPTPTPATGSVSYDNFSRNMASVPKNIFSRDLYLGITGNDVKQLQALLVNEVSYPADLITGYFGSITRNAVKNLQDKYGIRPVSGYFGAITRRALNAVISN